ncbi:ABC transporter permease [bacterium]|nr:ABC transporter permease [bacterium]
MNHSGIDLNSALLVNYFRTAVRKIRRQLGYAIINISGLGVGLACCAIMMLWVRNEKSFDRFHANRDSVYRLIKETRTNGEETLDARIPYPLAENIFGKIPEIKNYTRYQGVDTWRIIYGEKSFFNDYLSTADSTFFEIFTFPFIKGDPHSALKNRNSIVITESMAHKYFGDEDPIGKVLSIIQPGLTFTVTALIKDVPENSHLHFDCIIPIVNFWEWWDGRESGWDMIMFYSYIQLYPNSRPEEVGQKIAAVLNENVPRLDAGIRMQPLKDVHLKSNFGWDLDNYKQGNSSTINLFSLAALGVLLLAIINFINLATARSAGRAKEVGIRKINGAGRTEIISQFLGESIIISLLAFLLSMVLVKISLPLFNSLADRQIIFLKLFEPQLFLPLLATTLLTGILSGSYPAFFLSSFQPASVLKGEVFNTGKSQAPLRRILVVIQFTITIFLITVSAVVSRQLKYARSSVPGMDTSNIIITEGRFRVDEYQAVKNSLLGNPEILNVTYSDPPNIDQRGFSDVTWEGKDPASVIQFFPVRVDPDYLKTFGTGMSAGRFFSDEFTTDRTESVVINETAARRMGMESPLGKKLMIGTRSYTIIGIIKDFHQTALSKPIEPMILTYSSGYPNICIRVNPSGLNDVIPFIETTLKSFNWEPDRPFRYELLDERIEKFYVSDKKTESILSVFRVIALFTACLGLLGLASFMAEKRRREIGVRKIFGGSVPGLVWLQAWEFLKLIALSGVISAPFAYRAAEIWLSRSAYHFDPGIDILLIPVLVAMTVAFSMVGYQSLRASMANPVDSLRHE